MTIEKSYNFSVSEDLFMFIVIGLALFGTYFFFSSIQTFFFKTVEKMSKKVGVYSATKEFQLQRYVYQHSTGFVSWLYTWVNQQLIALGLKRVGVTVVGYLIFWGVVSFIVTIPLNIVTGMGFAFFPIMFVGLFIVALVMTRVTVSERMEMREADVMNAVDLIVPEVKNGVKNAIITYKDNFAPSVRDDFNVFISNIQERGYSFEDAMFILADNLGMVFQDFAQKAVYFERVGDREMVEIFADISETNRLRRQLRDENNNAFAGLKSTFLVLVAMVCVYFGFLMVTDSFSRNFFLQETVGKFLLLVFIAIIFYVLSYITTIKSKVI
jgi:Flp pilus assembly protein TadB